MLRALRAAAQPVELVWAVSPAARAAALARGALGVPSGTRCLLLHSPDAERVASQVGLALRRGGFVPVLSPLGVDSVTEQAVQGAVAALTRTGAAFYAACGDSSILDTVKAAAAVSTNPGPLLGSNAEARTMRVPSVPVLLVPAGAGATGAASTADVYCAGRAWVSVSPAPGSLQACLASPGAAPLLPDSSAVLEAAAALADCVEAVGTPSPLARRARLAALHGAVRAACALWALAAPGTGNSAAAAANALAAGVCGSLAAAAVPLGATRGLARAVSSQYRVSQATAAAAVLPAVVRRTVDALVELLLDADAEGDDGAAEAEGGGGGDRPDDAAELAGWDRGGGAEAGGDPLSSTDFDLPALPASCSAALRAAAAAPWMGAGDATNLATARRLGVLACALGAARIAAAAGSAGRPSAPPAPLPVSLTRDVPGWVAACEALVSEVDALAAAATRLAPASVLLPAALGGADALRSVAEAAEVDAHTLGHAVSLSRSQLVEVLAGVPRRAR